MHPRFLNRLLIEHSLFVSPLQEGFLCVSFKLYDTDSAMATPQGIVTTALAMDPVDISTDQVSKQDKQEEVTQSKPNKSRRAVLVFSLLSSLGLIALDSNIITTALPTIAKDFSISNSAFSWTGGAILLAQAVFGPLFAKVSYVAKSIVSFADNLGQLSDIFGRKPTLLGSIVIFMVGSIVCSRSNSAGMLIAGRVSVFIHQPALGNGPEPFHRQFKE